MRKTREILRLKWELRLSNRDAARSVGVSPGTVVNVLSRAATAGLDGWASVESMSEEELEARFYQRPQVPIPPEERAEPDCAWIHRELRRPGVTLELLHHEYLEQHPNGLRYSAFCERYRVFRERRRLSMRQHHVAGDKMFVDYSGKRPHLVNPSTGELIEVELFVAVLGASNYTYAEVTRTQQVPDFIGSHMRAVAFFGGVPRITVPDNLKSGVTKACRYEPTLQRSYADFADHYGTAIVPARPYKPRDKAKVEVAVQIAQRWILGRMRNRVFHTLVALNAAIRECIADLNARVMRDYKASRRDLYERYERTALLPLPVDRFDVTEWKQVRANVDYHVAFDDRLYSVPSRHKNEDLWIRATATTVEVLLRGNRVAAHPRRGEGRYATIPEHMPSSHRAQAEWTPSRILAWAEKVGPNTRALCDAILRERPHPEMGFRSCLGILRLAKQYDDERLERACGRAVAVHARSYRSVESMLRHGLDNTPLPEDGATVVVDHENLRGPDYYVN
ncbi:MAG TPA: IS21 family transposase [Polyangiales bacterium]